MILRQSRFVHVLTLGANSVLVIHALTHLRLGVDDEVAHLIAWFKEPRSLPDEIPALTQYVHYDTQTLAGCIASLIERGVLTEKSPEEELAETALTLKETHGRDPGEMIERYRRERQEGTNAYWAVSSSYRVSDLGDQRARLDLLLFGDCELQMEADFLRREGTKRGLDLHIAATFPDDIRLAGERQHHAIIVGALRSRHTIADDRNMVENETPFQHYIAEARQLLEGLRAQSSAPIFIDNLPEPTVQPLGFANRGIDSHRNRFRRANLALEELAAGFDDVYVIDIAAALAAAGAERLLDDGLTSFTHFGSPGWMLQRPQSEMAAVHGLFPDPAPLAAFVEANPYGRETTVARAHADALITVIGIDRKKCVIVDLDGVLWPGVLAETGAPFAWHSEISGLYSYVGLFFGIHEALKSLKRRGIILAAVSKNDEAIVRELWRYPSHYPHERLLTPDDFVTWRINWNDKSENIQSIATELGLATNTFAFIDDHPVERERIRQMMPEIAIWGEDLFSLRRILLSDPRLQQPYITQESGTRTDLVKSQLGRAQARSTMRNEAEFLASLNIEYEVERLVTATSIDRVHELFERTTQFNTTGRKFSAAELTLALGHLDTMIFTMKVRDRFGDHGLVGAAVVAHGEIVGFALSCRVIGLGVEQKFLDAILTRLELTHNEITARIIETSRNIPARNLYRDSGFTAHGDGVWKIQLREPERAQA